VYTIKHAAALTGIPADTLRMWERRYGVVAPVRTEGGYRLYDDAAIARLIAMHALVAAGWAPREAAAQVASGTTLGPTTPQPQQERPDDSAQGAEARNADLDLLVTLAVDLQPQTLSRGLDDMFARHDVGELIDTWLMPALVRLGDAWQRGDVSVAGEHFVTAGVHRRLAAALDKAPATPPGAPKILVGLAGGSRHELGVLAFAVLLRHTNFDVTYIGGDVPTDSWVVAVATSDPDAVVLAAHATSDLSAVRDVVAAIRAAKPHLPVFLGGSHQRQVGGVEHLGNSLQHAASALAERYRAEPLLPGDHPNSAGPDAP
jgi:DNA-binding transcriptional MerR regulator/methylmalonyl-CoA mutase cobalamin-binding subunit